MYMSYFYVEPEHIKYEDYSESEDDIKFMTLCEVLYKSQIGKYEEHEVTVPSHFFTNFASVPKIFRNIVPNVSRENKIYLLHDYLYTVHLFTRKEADDILRAGCRACGMSKSRAFLVYWSVRIGAKKAWNN